MLKKYFFIIISAIAILLLYFQNCANESSPLVLQSDYSSSVPMPPLPINHPEEKTITQTVTKFQLVNRDYIMASMQDIFSNNDGVVIGELDSVLDKWVLTKSGQFGLGCDTTSSYTGQDCPSQVDSSNLPVFMDDNTVRESYISQLCQNILGIDSAVLLVKSKVSPEMAYPNREAIINIYNLFYRANDPNDNTINTLLDFDRALAENNEDPLNRWRGVILQVCETPGWQLF